ncbi:hypothetical protein BHE74_00047992 [Ensete ventricosum]|nr:hypothetical protein GW17_00028555 [Ensete ventricosum]RWW46102.1 hypothetical protein BHE74_00047992 [Ensete ventricosum]RZR92028.1 hypothetical protein BHM03_00020251 [Ensete ventricosum]
MAIVILTCWSGCRCNDLNALRRKLKMSGAKNSSDARVESSPPEVEEIHVEATPKRPVGSSAPEQVATARLEKWVKMTVKNHKSRHGEGSSQAAARGKEPAALTEEDSSPTYLRPKLMKDLCDTRVFKDNEGYYVLQIVDWTPKDSDATMQARWPNLTYSVKVWDNSQAASEFRKGVLHPILAKDHYTSPSKTLKAELRSKSIIYYKQAVGFGWGLRRMGHLSYEYGYRVALARFQARYLDLEADSDPFTEKPEDSSVPMETRQEFDDSVPAEE